MSKKFYAVNRKTGEIWKPIKKYTSFGFKQYLVMYDSGYCAVVTHDFYIDIEPLDLKIWKVFMKP